MLRRLPRMRCGAALRAGAASLAGLLLAAGGRAFAQSSQPAPASFRVKLWSTSSGLPQNTINDILQVRTGELWVATFAGLLRFDGFEFHVLDLESLAGLPSNRITALAPDGDEGLWLATQSGDLVHLRDGRIAELHRAPTADEEAIALVRARDGSLWTQSSNGAVRRCDGGGWTIVVPPGHEGRYRGMCAHPDGTVAAAVGDALEIFEPSGERIAALHSPASVLSIAVRSEGGWWVGLPDGLAHAERGASPRSENGSIERVRDGVPAGLRVTAIAEYGANELWLGTPVGLARVRLDSQSARALLTSDEPQSKGIDVRSLARDREGNLWMGSKGQGLARMRPQRVQSFDFLARGNPASLAEDGDGGAWFACECLGLFHLANGEWQPREEPIEFEGGGQVCAQALLFDRKGRLWIGRDQHVLRREADGEFVPMLGDRKLSGTIGAIAEEPRDAGDATDAANGSVWIAARSGSLLKIGADDSVLEELAISEPIISLAAARDGSAWIGSTDAVLHAHDRTVDRFGASAGVARGDVRDVSIDSDGSVWLASYGGGLGRLRDGRAQWLSRARGLPSNSLSCIRSDEHGRLWLLSNLGLVVVDRADVVEALEGRRPRVDPIVIGPEAGVAESSYGSPAGFRDRSGRLWFGTIAGAVRVDADEFPFNRVPPHVRIEKVEADETELPISDAIAIPPGTRRVLIHFTAFALSAPERVRFRYRLDGFDEDWIDVGAERQASFTALAPRGYDLRVAARNEDGVWSTEPASLHVAVLPMWWQSMVFRAGALLAAASCLIALHRLRVATIRKRATVLLHATEGRARAEERESRMREALAHAGRVTTAGELATSLAHEVNQPLAAIVANAQAGRRFLGRGDLAREELDEILRDIAQQGQRASEVIRRLREFLKKRGAARRPLDVNSIVRDMLPLVRRELEDNHVAVELELDPDQPGITADPVELQQVLVNLVKNACEAMSSQAGKRRIDLCTSAREGRVRIDVSDTGPGLAPEVEQHLFQPYVTTKPSGMGLGLPICRSIVEAHGGRLSAKSAPNGGVVFCVDLPADDETRTRTESDA